MAEEYGRDLCFCGYHVYQDVWEAAVGETLVCSRCNSVLARILPDLRAHRQTVGLVRASLPFLSVYDLLDLTIHFFNS